MYSPSLFPLIQNLNFILFRRCARRTWSRSRSQARRSRPYHRGGWLNQCFCFQQSYSIKFFKAKFFCRREKERERKKEEKRERKSSLYKKTGKQIKSCHCLEQAWTKDRKRKELFADKERGIRKTKQTVSIVIIRAAPKQGGAGPWAEAAPKQGGAGPVAGAASKQGGAGPRAEAGPKQGGAGPGAVAASKQGGAGPGAEAAPKQGGTGPGAGAAPKQGGAGPGAGAVLSREKPDLEPEPLLSREEPALTSRRLIKPKWFCFQKSYSIKFFKTIIK